MSGRARAVGQRWRARPSRVPDSARAGRRSAPRHRPAADSDLRSRSRGAPAGMSIAFDPITIITGDFAGAVVGEEQANRRLHGDRRGARHQMQLDDQVAALRSSTHGRCVGRDDRPATRRPSEEVPVRILHAGTRPCRRSPVDRRRHRRARDERVRSMRITAWCTGASPGLNSMARTNRVPGTASGARGCDRHRVRRAGACRARGRR